MMKSDIKLINSEGKRLDGRGPEDLRKIKIESGVLHRADGSCYLEWGGNKVFAAVYGPREAVPRHCQNPLRAIVQARYTMAAFSVEDRKRPGPDRRSVEISKVISEALERVILTEQFPRATVDVNIEVLDAEAGTRCAGLTAAGVALVDAGIPMRDIPVACAAGLETIRLLEEKYIANAARMGEYILGRLADWRGRFSSIMNERLATSAALAMGCEE
jgi:exosome complex component RRP41